MMKQINDMPKNNSFVQGIRNNPLPWMVQIVGIMVLILNLWLASKLSPISKTAEVNAYNIEQIKREIITKAETELQFASVEKRLDRIEAKLDRLIER